MIDRLAEIRFARFNQNKTYNDHSLRGKHQ